MNAWIGTPLELLIASIACAAIGVWWLRRNHLENLRGERDLSGYWPRTRSSSGGGIMVLLGIVGAGIAIVITIYGGHSVSRLEHEIQPYPNAKYEWSRAVKDHVIFEFRTKDALEEVTSFYERATNHAIARFETLDGGGLVSRKSEQAVTIWVERTAEGTKITYELKQH